MYQRSLNEDDLVWLYSTTLDAFMSINNIHEKSGPCVDGEVFTHMRRASRDAQTSKTIKGLFNGKAKNFICRLDGRASKRDKELLFKMYDGIRRCVMGKEPDPLSELEQALLSMRSSVDKIKKIASHSEVLRSGLESIRIILEDNEPFMEEDK
jgi:hypothetical protein